jgi:predicted TIM-barrel fold metal-dependent hydrolase
MFIDIHAHVYRRPVPWFRFAAPQQVLERYDELGIEQGVILPLIGPEVYLPQSNEDVLAIVEHSGGRFVPFCNVDPRALTNSADAPLGDVLRHYRDRGCRGIGEVMPNLPFLHPLVQNLFKHTEDVGLQLTFDISTRIGGAYGLYDDPGLPQLEACLRRFPRLAILGHGPPFWAEIARLETPGERAGYPKHPVTEEGVVPKLFRRYPNLYGDLSAGSGYNALHRDPEYAAGFLEEFQDRLMFGTDICSADQELPLAGFLEGLVDAGKLSRSAFRKIASENARKLLRL